MAAFIVNNGKKFLLEFALGVVSPDDFIVHLYNNTPTLSDTTVVGDLTETSFTGYVGYTLSGGWNTATVTSNVATSVNSGSAAFNCTGTGDTITGYWISSSSNGILAAEDFGSPITVVNGDSIQFTPKFSLGDC